MSVRFRYDVLDGFIAGPHQSLENPLGEGGMQLHGWVFGLEAWRKPQGLEGGEVNASTPVVERSQENVGAYVMGRNMFGGGTGPWPGPVWNGWWGDGPPYHAPVFVVTHHARDPLPLEGGTTFFFVTDGVERRSSRPRRPRAQDVVPRARATRSRRSGWGPSRIGVSVAPVLLGSGTRLPDGLPQMQLELVDAADAPVSRTCATG